MVKNSSEIKGTEMRCLAIESYELSELCTVNVVNYTVNYVNYTVNYELSELRINLK